MYPGRTVPYVRERALAGEYVRHVDSMQDPAANDSRRAATNQSHSCIRRGYLEGMSPLMQRRMRMYKYARFFLVS
jgi:hypothetical protein